MGIRVFRPYNIEQDILKTQIGSFAITSFPVPHNGTPNRAFIIKADGETVLYLTDAEFCAYKLKSENITAMLVECNYDERIIDSTAPNYRHSCLGHMELQTCKQFISENYNDCLKKIILIHMSNDNLDREIALKEVKSTIKSNTEVFLANSGLVVEV
jgi:ribonuclease BN (tRNA processing enzyme)